jgi:transcriptional regulator with XRE-family HTH domain
MAGIEIVTDRWGSKHAVRGRAYPDWELGLEHIEQEGSSAWQAIREKRGLSPEQLESVSSSEVMWEEVRMYEDRPGMPTLDQLAWLARLEGTSPGALLDRIIETEGREIRDVDPPEGPPSVLQAAQRVLATCDDMREAEIIGNEPGVEDLREALTAAGVAL